MSLPVSFTVTFPASRLSKLALCPSAVLIFALNFSYADATVLYVFACPAYVLTYVIIVSTSLAVISALSLPYITL